MMQGKSYPEKRKSWCRRFLSGILPCLVLAVMALPAGTAMASDLQEDVLHCVNIEREAAGVQPLASSAALSEAAGVRAKEIGVVFAHQRPDGRTAKSALRENNVSWFGENLAISSTPDASQIVRAWMNSPTHRANLLNRHFTKMGVARVKHADGHYYWAQELSDNK